MAIQVEQLLNELQGIVSGIATESSVKIYSPNELRKPDLKPILPCISLAYLGINRTRSDKNLIPAIQIAIYYLGVDECDTSNEVNALGLQSIRVMDELRKQIINCPTILHRTWDFISEKPIIIKEPKGRNILSLVQVYQVLAPQIGRA
jgi:hypothetical protein